MPPTVRYTWRLPAEILDRRDSRCPGERPAPAKRSTRTPLVTTAASTPYSSRRRRLQGSLTTSTRSGSTMAASWHSIRAGVVKSSMWCTVRNSRNPPPRSCTRAAALAEMQSWVCTMSKRSPKRASPDVRASMCEKTLSVRVPARGGASTMWDRHRGGPEEPLLRVAQGDQRHVDALGGQSLGQFHAVHSPAPGPHRVGGDGDPCRERHAARLVDRSWWTSAGSRLTSAAAARAARALVSATMHPASRMIDRCCSKSWGSRPVPST